MIARGASHRSATTSGSATPENTCRQSDDVKHRFMPRNGKPDGVLGSVTAKLEQGGDLAARLEFVLDRQRGKLFRSQDWGATWAAILTVPGSALDPFTGFLAADPTTVGRLWLTTNEADGTYVIENAQDQLPNCVAMVNCTKDATPVNPGPVTVRSDGKVFIAGRIAPGVDAELWSASSPFATWTRLATPEYRGAAVLPLSVAATSSTDQHVYVGTAGNGVVVLSGVS